MSVSSAINYSLKGSSVPAKSFRYSLTPSNGTTFTNSSSIYFDIPTSSVGQFQDGSQSYLKMSISNNNAFYLDNNGACVIARISIFHRGALVEDIQEYNVTYTTLLDISLSPSQRVAMSSIYGTEQVPFTTAGNPITGVAWSNRQGLGQIAGGGSQTVCLPILSTVIGCLQEKMLPLGFMNGGDLRVQIDLETSAKAVTSTVANGNVLTVSNPELVLQILELSPETSQQVFAMNNGVFMIQGNSYHAYNASQIPNTQTGSINVLVPARFASLKSIYLAPLNYYTVANAYSTSSRVNAFSQASYLMNGIRYPQRPFQLTGQQASEAHAEVLKASHALNSVGSHSGALPYTYYNVADNTNTGLQSYLNGFLIGLDTENFSKRGDSVFSGLNTLSSNVFFQADLGAARTNAIALVFICYHDCLLKIENGALTSSW